MSDLTKIGDALGSLRDVLRRAFYPWPLSDLSYLAERDEESVRFIDWMADRFLKKTKLGRKLVY